MRKMTNESNKSPHRVMHVFWTDLEIISGDVLLKLNHSLAQLRVRLINCWMSALKAKVSAMAAAALLPGFTISLSLRFLVELSHKFLEDLAGAGCWSAKILCSCDIVCVLHNVYTIPFINVFIHIDTY